MRIEKINDNKIKVILSTTDLNARNIDFSTLNYNSAAAQELFWDMMEQAEIQYGFNASDAQLAIEAVPDSDEGFVVTITKLDEEGDFESMQKYIKHRFKKADLRVKRKSKKVCSSIIIYSFNNFDDLCALSKKIQPVYSGDSTLYKYKETYYLLLTRNNFITSDTKTFEVLLCEYGHKVLNASFYEGYLCEHGTILIEYDAVEVINSYF